MLPFEPAVFKTPQQIIVFHHQRRNRPQALTPEPLLHALKIALEWVRGAGESGTQEVDTDGYGGVF